MQTKKLLVPFAPSRPEWNSTDFLIPRLRESKVELRGVDGGERFEFGRMVYIGLPVKESDLFARLVDSGTRIESVEDALISLRRYIDLLQGIKIGSVARIDPLRSNGHDFGLEVVARSTTELAKRSTNRYE